MSTKTIKKPSACYSNSCFTHYFSANNMKVEDMKNLLLQLQASQYNGYWNHFKYKGKIMSISYMTSDILEAREEFANELASDIADLLR